SLSVGGERRKGGKESREGEEKSAPFQRKIPLLPLSAQGSLISSLQHLSSGRLH
ncbi:hypothetical protein AMECASPLE_027382, partial [Ameca splendens]